jgi:hypothetical protein
MASKIAPRNLYSIGWVDHRKKGAMRAGETELQMCIRHVAEQEARIAWQEALIGRLRKSRSALLDDAVRLLGEMHGFLDAMRVHVARLSN